MLVSSGCAGMHLQDKAQLETAKVARTTYAEAKVDEVILDEKKNLEAQLAAEIEIVRANYQLRLDYAFLRMADDEKRPMADSRITRAAKRLNSLGFVADKERDADGDVLNQTQKLRAYLIQEQLLELKGRELQQRLDFIVQASGKRPPKCRAGLPAELPFLDELLEDQRFIVEDNYGRYKKACDEALEKAPETRQALIDEKGEIRSAYSDWQAALKEHENLRKAIEERSAAVAQAKDAHEQAVKQASAGGPETEKKVRDAAAKLGEALKQAEKFGVLPEERIKALTTIVLAVASQGPDGKVETENLDTAIVVAGQIPVIAGQIAALREAGQAPSVSALLIELRQQTIRLDHAREQQALVGRRASLHEARYKAFEDEARNWLAFHDALCSYAVRLAGKDHPGRECDAFGATLGAGTAVCTLSGQRIPASGDCALAKSWKATLASVPGDKAVKREFYKALAAFSQAMAARAPQDEYEYRLVHLDHLEVVAANRSAIRAWDSLVKVPLDQIEAYHAAGIPPEKIAELIVTGVTLGAIAVGVNR